MTYDDSERSRSATGSSPWVGLVIVVVLAALVGLGTWLTASLLRSSDSVTAETPELSAAQHTEQLVRVLRISAASDRTPSSVQTIPNAALDSEQVTCGSRYATALEQATVRFYGIDYVSTVAGARDTDTSIWTDQQSEAHDGALALHGLFPAECDPLVPVVFDIQDTLQQADGIGVQRMLHFADDLIDEWSQLYLLAETAQQRQLAAAGLWQVIRWEASWQPGRSPFAFSN